MSSIYNKYIKYKTKYLQLVNAVEENEMIGGGEDFTYSQNVIEANVLNNNMIGGGEDFTYAQNVIEAHVLNNNMIGGGGDLTYAQNVIEAHSLNNNMIGGNRQAEIEGLAHENARNDATGLIPLLHPSWTPTQHAIRNTIDELQMLEQADISERSSEHSDE